MKKTIFLIISIMLLISTVNVLAFSESEHEHLPETEYQSSECYQQIEINDQPIPMFSFAASNPGNATSESLASDYLQKILFAVLSIWAAMLCLNWDKNPDFQTHLQTQQEQ